MHTVAKGQHRSSNPATGRMTGRGGRKPGGRSVIFGEDDQPGAPGARCSGLGDLQHCTIDTTVCCPIFQRAAAHDGKTCIDNIVHEAKQHAAPATPLPPLYGNRRTALRTAARVRPRRHRSGWPGVRAARSARVRPAFPSGASAPRRAPTGPATRRAGRRPSAAGSGARTATGP